MDRLYGLTFFDRTACGPVIERPQNTLSRCRFPIEADGESVTVMNDRQTRRLSPVTPSKLLHFFMGGTVGDHFPIHDLQGRIARTVRVEKCFRCRAVSTTVPHVGSESEGLIQTAPDLLRLNSDSARTEFSP